MQTLLGPDIVVELITQESGVVADPESIFFDAIRATMEELAAGMPVIPFLNQRGTDAPLLPNMKVYEFFPFLNTPRQETYKPLVHGHNERIHIDDPGFAAHVTHEIIVAFCT